MATLGQITRRDFYREARAHGYPVLRSLASSAMYTPKEIKIVSTERVADHLVARLEVR